MAVLTDPLGWFTLHFPDEWSHKTEDCVTILTSPLGTVYVSGGRHAGGRQPSFGGADFLARFLRSIGVSVEEAAIQGTSGHGCRVYYYRRESDGLCWRHWSVTDDETALLVTYTCNATDDGREVEEVDDLVDSIRLFHSAPA
jgi:hypothetical protein